jgi:hypothetical protein
LSASGPPAAGAKLFQQQIAAGSKPSGGDFFVGPVSSFFGRNKNGLSRDCLSRH